MRIDYHRTLIADTVRNAAFHRALSALITPGVTTVADIGAGTGLLGLMAMKLGARKIYLYETAEVASVAAAILKANRARTCELIPVHSVQMMDPPRVDVVVSETLGNYPFEENIIATLADAHARFLNPGGVTIPASLTQFVAPVVSARIHHELTAWDRVGLDLDLRIPRTMSLNNAYVRLIEPADLLANGQRALAWDQLTFAKTTRSTRKGEASWVMDAPATIYGLATWWEAALAPDITLSTAPDAPRTHWEQLYWPLLDPLPLAAREQLSIQLRSRSSEEGGTHLAWTATRLDARGKQSARQSLDLDKGFLP
jgi:PRMT5 oligomerisation domain/Ribosomal protein L11 methyltransferase (PrmA)